MTDLEKEFDCGDELAKVRIGDMGNIVPDNSDKILVIDADTIAYRACLLAEEKVDILPQNFYRKDEWEQIINNPTYDEENCCYYVSNLNTAINCFEAILDKIKFNTGCDNYKLFFTIGKNNFRYKLYPEYKCNRVATRLPLYIKEIKEFFIENNSNAIACVDYEADDAVCYEKEVLGDKAILCAIDKDVLNAVKGIHFNYYESGKHNIKMHFEEEVSERDAKMWPYVQCITGDTSDNIVGIKGYGVSKAINYLYNEDESKWWDKVLELYEKNGLSPEKALLNYRLVCMTQVIDGKVFLAEKPLKINKDIGETMDKKDEIVSKVLIINNEEKDFVKDFKNKLQYDLIPPEVTKSLAKVLTYGANKYSPNNWKNCKDKDIYISALYRHIEEWRSGNKNDDETGFNHLEHALCNLAFLVYFETKGK